jgi:hypothetical protein
MPTQLKFFEAAKEDPNVQWLERVLDETKGWLTAAALAERSCGVLSDREIRILANASPYVLSGPGSPGYRHLKHASTEEKAHWPNALISQGKSMLRSGVRLKRTAHAMIEAGN